MPDRSQVQVKIILMFINIQSTLLINDSKDHLQMVVIIYLAHLIKKRE